LIKKSEVKCLPYPFPCIKIWQFSARFGGTFGGTLDKKALLEALLAALSGQKNGTFSNVYLV